ncbi:alpha/beta fold hydrolase [Myroides fluvii]|uniref:alpha/beta fold hydrolase n=1 Tax=Myroides fluvii TaxID=2572594 RepID=UPI00131B6651|nr:alpha/beta fold hydrolase [Myroides fluvii]
MKQLHTIQITDYLFPDQTVQTLYLNYEIFGQPLHQAPIVLVNHALTGNSTVTGEQGWWKELIGYNQAIDLNRYTVLAFNIPGNGYANKEEQLFPAYTSFTTALVADVFWKGLDFLRIPQLYAIIGGSLGGSIAWEMALQRPQAIQHLIPIATNLQASDWLIGQVAVQEAILNHSSQPLEDARKHAMLLYRTPESINQKFTRVHPTIGDTPPIESWLTYHGQALKKRFQLAAYRLMNHLLKTIGREITEEQLRHFAGNTTATITVVAVNSDNMFTQKEQRETYCKLYAYGANINYKEIQSIHGHDAFLMEYEQLQTALQPLF